MKKLFALFFLVCFVSFLSAPFVLANETKQHSEVQVKDLVKSNETVIEDQAEFSNPIQIVDIRKQSSEFYDNKNTVSKSDFKPIHYVSWNGQYRPAINSNIPDKDHEKPIIKERNN